MPRLGKQSVDSRSSGDASCTVRVPARLPPTHGGGSRVLAGCRLLSLELGEGQRQSGDSCPGQTWERRANPTAQRGQRPAHLRTRRWHPGSRLLGTRVLQEELGDPGSRVPLARRERSFGENQTDRQTLCCFPKAISQSREPREGLVAYGGRSSPADVRPAEGPQGSIQESERKQAGPGRSSPRSPRGCTVSRAPERCTRSLTSVAPVKVISKPLRGERKA